ncbi:universal stress protein [Natrinema hispanicum]|uniref:Nucleotide-binding universal stress protein, UspA family n=1 Tax=Natrinema hispanicum TaxID=392421 RepID=A0A1G6VWF4_9EURY|nr:universal stress protein [Natrinema hispanicum]SDD57919.1 Nucleotide-binding universal stress protein, UspA family [Natrinema hispanicum]SET95680.1 Nucleotide-binding universal stress protein, UspA family [Natrinema hispanicum]
MPWATQSIDAVLLPTDGSDGALAGAKRGIDLATTVGAEVHVLSVADTTDFDDLSLVLDTDAVAEERDALEADAESAVEAVATIAQEQAPDLEVTTAIEQGTPFQCIDDYVDTAEIDLIAMGTKGRTGLERVVLGSVTENVLRTVDIPVLVVPPAAESVSLTRETTEHILLPTDGSEGAAAAVDRGVHLADVFDSMVHALYSADTSRLTMGSKPSTILSELERTGETALESVRDRAKASGVSVTGTVANGPPARVILEYADEKAVNLIVIGTHGRSGLERHLLGSVTENVVRNADVPVVCVPMPNE